LFKYLFDEHATLYILFLETNKKIRSFIQNS